MGNKLYTDVHVRRAVVDGLRLRGVDVLTSQEDGTTTLADPLLLDRAFGLQRIIFTQDDDFLREANRRQQTGELFGGVVYAHQLNATIRECIDDLLLIAQASEWGEWLNSVEYLPLK
jgi:predicted nuclease of predicted toxin-antitoxin system